MTIGTCGREVRKRQREGKDEARSRLVARPERSLAAIRENLTSVWLEFSKARISPPGRAGSQRGRFISQHPLNQSGLAFRPPDRPRYRVPQIALGHVGDHLADRAQ